MKLSANTSVLLPRPRSVCPHFNVVLSIKGSSLFSLNRQQTSAARADDRPQGTATARRREYLLTKPERALFCFITKENFAFFFLLIKGVLWVGVFTCGSIISSEFVLMDESSRLLGGSDCEGSGVPVRLPSIISQIFQLRLLVSINNSKCTAMGYCKINESRLLVDTATCSWKANLWNYLFSSIHNVQCMSVI